MACLSNGRMARAAAARSSKFLTLIGSIALAHCVLAAFALIPQASLAADAPVEDAYQSVWKSLAEHLRRREYGVAAAFLETLNDDADLQPFAKQIEADKAAVAGLQAFEVLVHQQAEELKEGESLTISGIDYTFVKFETGPTGDEFVLKSKSTGKESRKAFTALPSATWVQLSKPKLSTLKNAPLVLGVFLGFDQSADFKTARKLLNEAASDGADVGTWLARIEAVELARKSPRTDVDRPSESEPKVLSTWVHQVQKNGKVVRRQTLTLYSNGKINHADSNATWEIKGRILVLSWPAPDAPGGQWRDICNLSADGNAYVGKNQTGFTLVGAKIGGAKGK